jgi:hypothetical protein
LEVEKMKFNSKTIIVIILAATMTLSLLPVSSIQALSSINYVVALDGSGHFTDIQKAIDAVPANTFGTITIKAGIYDLNPQYKYPFNSITLKSNIILRGEGIDKTIIRAFPDKQPFGSSVRYNVITSNTIENVAIEDLTVIQNGTPDNLGWGAIRLGTSTNVAVRNIKITDVTGEALSYKGPVIVENCIIDRVWTGILILGPSQGGIIRNNRVFNTGGDGIFPGANFGAITDLLVENNHLENITDVAIDIVGVYNQGIRHSYITAKGNKIVNGVIRVSGSDYISLIGNTLKDGFISIDAGQGHPTNVNVRENWIESFPLKRKAGGDSTYTSAGIHGTGNVITITNNTIFSYSSEAQYAVSTWGSWTVTNNALLVPGKSGNAAANSRGLVQGNYEYKPSASPEPVAEYDSVALFSDDFETGNLNAWTGTGTWNSATAPTIDSTNPHQGTYNAKSTINNGQASFLYKNIAEQTTVYARTYHKWSVNPTTNTEGRLIWVYGPNGLIAIGGIRNNNGVLQFYMRYLKNGAYVTTNYNHAFSANRYYSIELYVRVHGSSGETALYVDGVKIINDTGFDNDDRGKVNQVRVGLDWGFAQSWAHQHYWDSVKIANTYIGTEYDSVALFSDDFETGNLNAWTGTGTWNSATAPTIDSTNPHQGTYNAKSTINNGQASFLYKNIAEQTTVYARTYHKWSVNPTTNTEGRLIWVYGPNGLIAIGGIRNNNGVLQFYMRYLKNGAYVTTNYNHAFSANRYYSIELYVRVHGSSGETALYVDGVKIINDTGFDNDDRGKVNQVRVGLDWGFAQSWAHQHYWDSVKIANTYIGT